MGYYSPLKKLLPDDLECHFFDTISSTNLFLKNSPTSKKNQLCVAREQTQGKGQHGRQWLSQKDGSILFSIRKIFAQEANLNGFSLVVGLAIIKVLEEECLVEGFKIKWPNDIYFKSKKIAGILLENQIQLDNQFVVIGVGVNYNLNQNFNCEIPWTDLSNSAKKLPDIHSLTAKLIDSILFTSEHFKMNGLSNLLDQWDRYDMLKESKVRLIESGQPIEGKVTGISQQGALQVLTQNGVKELYSSKYIEFI
ncbi:MAG: biotin--[acetyl-CoA-carboxylase] ligase [Thiotrichales bacterium]|nr:biotin--[acetyl-CoA-carboxylase] ligase [Thiotrichales bacterium]